MTEVVSGSKGEKMEWALPASISPCFHRGFPDSPPDTDGKALFILVQGGGAITTEVMIAVNARVSFPQEVDRILTARRFPSPRLPDMNLLAPLLPTVLPRRLGRAAIEQLLIKILHNQDSFTHDFWDLINSLGYRMDKTELEREKDRDRLWKLEHPKTEVETCV